MALHRLLRATLEPVVILAAIATLPLTLLEARSEEAIFYLADWVVWVVFVLEYVALLVTAPDRPAFIKRNLLLTAIIVLSVPVAPNVFGLARLARVLRSLRFVVIGLRAIPALRETVGRRHASIYAVCVTLLLIACGGAALTLFEPSLHGDFGSGLWWAVVTVTTVGYGDISPATIPGRLVAVALMVAGIGLTATVAASIAAHFVDQDTNQDYRAIAARLDRIEQLLFAGAQGQTSPATPELSEAIAETVQPAERSTDKLN